MKGALLLVNLLLLAGCSDSGEPPAESGAATQPQHVLEQQVESLEKAQQVEQELLDAQQRRDEQLR